MAPQPATPPAADPTNPQVPGQQPATPPAETPPAQSTIQLTDDQKNYLKGQGISDADLTSPDALTKIITHAQSSQKTLAQTKAELDKLKPAVPPQFPGVPPAPTQPAQPTATPQPTEPTPTPTQGLDAVTSFTLATSLATQYPTLKDELMNGKLYQDMQTMGIPLVSNGQVNVSGLTMYAKNRSHQLELEAKVAAAGRPTPDDIPDVNPTSPQQPQTNFDMTPAIARAIMVQDPNHPRAAEARAMLSKVGGGK